MRLALFAVVLASCALPGATPARPIEVDVFASNPDFRGDLIYAVGPPWPTDPRRVYVYRNR